ncbi:hypothetical protein CC78DRAFT_619881 [Lojkania enalia]|uniref:Uncharacterized protein n=1 Tax=Lojkania enalia TaxID=147567 RepID=A0A9P4K4T9_9PLEO|nr:hypothetical protein CC78DRAFT_619881 [Didymosphaeria enalia]
MSQSFHYPGKIKPKRQLVDLPYNATQHSKKMQQQPDKQRWSQFYFFSPRNSALPQTLDQTAHQERIRMEESSPVPTIDACLYIQPRPPPPVNHFKRAAPTKPKQRLRTMGGNPNGRPMSEPGDQRVSFSIGDCQASLRRWLLLPLTLCSCGKIPNSKILDCKAYRIAKRITDGNTNTRLKMEPVTEVNSPDTNLLPSQLSCRPSNTVSKMSVARYTPLHTANHSRSQTHYSSPRTGRRKLQKRAARAPIPAKSLESLRSEQARKSAEHRRQSTDSARKRETANHVSGSDLVRTHTLPRNFKVARSCEATAPEEERARSQSQPGIRSAVAEPKKQKSVGAIDTKALRSGGCTASIILASSVKSVASQAKTIGPANQERIGCRRSQSQPTIGRRPSLRASVIAALSRRPGEQSSSDSSFACEGRASAVNQRPALQDSLNKNPGFIFSSDTGSRIEKQLSQHDNGDAESWTPLEASSQYFAVPRKASIAEVFTDSERKRRKSSSRMLQIHENSTIQRAVPEDNISMSSSKPLEADHSSEQDEMEPFQLGPNVLSPGPSNLVASKSPSMFPLKSDLDIPSSTLLASNRGASSRPVENSPTIKVDTKASNKLLKQDSSRRKAQDILCKWPKRSFSKANSRSRSAGPTKTHPKSILKRNTVSGAEGSTTKKKSTSSAIPKERLASDSDEGSTPYPSSLESKVTSAEEQGKDSLARPLSPVGRWDGKVENGSMRVVNTPGVTQVHSLSSVDQQPSQPHKRSTSRTSKNGQSVKNRPLTRPITSLRNTALPIHTSPSGNLSNTSSPSTSPYPSPTKSPPHPSRKGKEPMYPAPPFNPLGAHVESDSPRSNEPHVNTYTISTLTHSCYDFHFPLPPSSTIEPFAPRPNPKLLRTRQGQGSSRFSARRVQTSTVHPASRS